MTPPKLQGVAVKGVEFLSVGTWNGDPWTLAHLREIQQAFDDGNAGIEPPIKLGHTGAQTLLRNSGLPAAGFVERVYIEGQRILADLRDVPQKVADLMNSKAYSHLSAEILLGVKRGSESFARVLKGIALLGDQVPAVTNLEDFEALYGISGEQAEGLLGTYSWADDPEGAKPLEVKYERDGAGGGGGGDSDDEDEFDASSFLTQFDALMNKIEGALKGRKGVGAVKGFRRDMRRGLEGLFSASNSQEGDVDIAVLRKAVGLGEDATEAEVLAAIEAAKKGDGDRHGNGGHVDSDGKPVDLSKYVPLDNFRELQTEVGNMRNQTEIVSATAAVEAAMAEGKIVPANKEWALAYAVKDAEGFQQFVDQARPVVKLAGHGRDTPGASTGTEVTDEERDLAVTLGVSSDDLEAFKKDPEGWEPPESKAS